MNVATSLARTLLSQPARRAARNVWEDLRDWFDAFALGLRLMAGRRPLPRILLYFGYALGDDLLCTAVLRELRNRDSGDILMVSDHPELFVGNRDVTYVRPLWTRYDRNGSSIAVCRRFARIWGGRFSRIEYAPPLGMDRRRQPSRQIVAEMCERAGVTGTISVRPYLALTEQEKAGAAWARDCIAIQSGGVTARHPMQNKQWFEERFQGVVDALRQEFEFVQIGAQGDAALQHVTDCRGRGGVRQTAAILHHARLYVGIVGFLMHLARAVECPSVIVFGGREAPWQTGYACNLNLYSAVPCAPCWRDNTCDFARRCMNEISVSDVTAAIRQMMQRARSPLATEMIEIAPSDL